MNVIYETFHIPGYRAALGEMHLQLFIPLLKQVLYVMQLDLPEALKTRQDLILRENPTALTFQRYPKEEGHTSQHQVAPNSPPTPGQSRIRKGRWGFDLQDSRETSLLGLVQDSCIGSLYGENETFSRKRNLESPAAFGKHLWQNIKS